MASILILAALAGPAAQADTQPAAQQAIRTCTQIHRTADGRKIVTTIPDDAVGSGTSARSSSRGTGSASSSVSASASSGGGTSARSSSSADGASHSVTVRRDASGCTVTIDDRPQQE